MPFSAASSLTISEFHKHARNVRARCQSESYLPWRPHALVNRADSMENAGSWTVSGPKEEMEVPKNFKFHFYLQKTWRARYSAGNISRILFSTTFTSSIVPEYLPNVFSSVWPAKETKPRFDAMHNSIFYSVI